MKFSKEKLQSIFSLDSALIVCIFFLILLLPATIALLIKLPIAIYDSKTTFHIEGFVESISYSTAKIKNLDVPINLDFDCNCEITKTQLQNIKYLSAEVLEDNGTYKALVLTLDGKNVYDNIDLKGHSIGLALLLLFVVICFIGIKQINRKERKESEKHWNNIYKIMDIVRPKLEKYRKPALRLEKTSNERISRFGGKPLVENGFVWPKSNGKSLTFLAQIDLSEMSQEFQYDWLPQDGLLLFFYDLIEMPWGYDPQDREKWRVIYQLHPNHVAEPPEDLNTKKNIKMSYFTPKKIDILPDTDDIDLEGLGFSEDEIDAYLEIRSESDDAPQHQVGGFSYPVQNGMMHLQAQLVSNGIYLGGDKVTRTEEVIDIEAGADDWKLLFQFDSDKELGAMWGDAGMIYFWVQAEKARNKEFDNCWLILQCS